MAVAIGVKILHLAPIQRRSFNVVGRADSLVHDRALAHVTELKLDFCAEVSRRVVICVGHHEEFAVDDYGLTSSNIACSHIIYLNNQTKRLKEQWYDPGISTVRRRQRWTKRGGNLLDEQAGVKESQRRKSLARRTIWRR